MRNPFFQFSCFETTTAAATAAALEAKTLVLLEARRGPEGTLGRPKRRVDVRRGARLKKEA